MFKYTFIFITSHNTTCPTELGRHSALQCSFGMLHRALELTVFGQCEDPEVLTRLPRGTTDLKSWVRPRLCNCYLIQCPASGWLRIKHCTEIRVNLSLQKRLWQWISHLSHSWFCTQYSLVEWKHSASFWWACLSICLYLWWFTIHYFVIVKWGQSKL